MLPILHVTERMVAASTVPCAAVLAEGDITLPLIQRVRELLMVISMDRGDALPSAALDGEAAIE